MASTTLGRFGKGLAIVVVIGMLGFGLIFGTSALFGFNNVGAGERAVVFHSNGSLTTLDPGMYQWENTWTTDVIKYNVQTQVDHAKASAASSDLQEVNVEVTVQFHPDPTQITWIHQNIGHDYLGKVIQPAVQEAVKSSTAKHNATNIIQNRPAVKLEIEQVLQERLSASHILLDQVSITNVDFSDSFNHAIEASQEAKQNIVLEQNRLAVVELQAQQKVEEARGQAESARIISEAISAQGQGYIQLQQLQKWDGHYPTYLVIGSGSAPIPFLPITGGSQS